MPQTANKKGVHNIMEIRKSKETLILTQSEKAILLKAKEILSEIFEKCDYDSDIECYADEARDNIKWLLEDTEVKGGEPYGAINVTIRM